MSLQIKQNEAGETVVVETSVHENVQRLDTAELKLQIRQHAESINELQQQLEAVEKFEASTKTEDVLVLEEVKTPVIDSVVLEEVAKEEVKEVEEAPVEEIK